MDGENDGGFRPRNGGGFRPRGNFGGPREMHKATCSACGKETEVPFKPIEGRPVYCRDCYMKQKEQRS
jgi:CxxC-x17-CxxC domain-containing protein